MSCPASLHTRSFRLNLRTKSQSSKKHVWSKPCLGQPPSPPFFQFFSSAAPNKIMDDLVRSHFNSHLWFLLVVRKLLEVWWQLLIIAPGWVEWIDTWRHDLVQLCYHEASEIFIFISCSRKTKVVCSVLGAKKICWPFLKFFDWMCSSELNLTQ